MTIQQAFEIAIEHQKAGRLADAEVLYRQILAVQPNHADALHYLGVIAHQVGRDDLAVGWIRQALALAPNNPAAYSNLGLAYWKMGRLDEAVAAHRRALQLNPDNPEMHNNLGNVFKEQGDLEEAIAAYRHALRLKPEHPGVHSNLIYTLQFLPDEDGRTIAEEKHLWNRQFAEPLKSSVLPHTHDRNPERRLRIGYVSPYFRGHVVGRNLVPLFQHHDHERFEILCYSGVERPDTMTAAFRRHADQWRDTVAMTDEAIVERIRQDGVDILVDLAQHMGANRLPVFAREPAPVQVSFAGYPDGTGLEAIGYRISDRYLEEGFTAEDDGRKKQLCLIDSFWCYDLCGVEVAVNGLPGREGGRVTFGCLNNFCKINEPVLKLWARVLRKLPDSRLVLLSSAGGHRRRTVEILEREGIDARRVDFVDMRVRSAYLELYHRLDIVLDSFPYNGHTTSLDALWMGVPVVSLAGKQAVSRAGWSQLSNLGLPELVAFSEDDFVEIATQLAYDLPRLTELRTTLRARMQASSLMDAPRFSRSIEAAYRTMWRRWCAGQ